MKGKRRRHDPEFKARVTLEALKGVKTIQQIGKEFEVHPVQVSEWKKTMSDGATSVFGPGRGKDAAEDFEQEHTALHAKIGQVTAEVDFLRKKSRQLALRGIAPRWWTKSHPKLSRRKQCELLGMARSSVNYEPVAESAEYLRIKRLLDEIYLVDPCLGSRRLVTVFERDHAVKINRKHLQRLRREMGHKAIWCRPRTSILDDHHRKHPYLLRNLTIDQPD